MLGNKASMAVEKEKKTTKKVDGKNNLKSHLPGLFVNPDGKKATQYVRKCGFIPRVVNSEDVDALRDQGYEVIQFPRVNPAENQESFFLACDEYFKEGKIYPGVKINPEKDKTYKVIPCCYSNSQTSNDIFKNIL